MITPDSVNHTNSTDAENGKFKFVEEKERMLAKEQRRRLSEVCAGMPLTEETACGIGCFRGPLLQRFANKKAYVILYGILGLVFSASYSYLNGTITTLEKRFKIPSKTTGTCKSITEYADVSSRVSKCSGVCQLYLSIS